ncbi:MAG: hypothetical protein J5726_10590 [Treponema sp.]|nr:hypothetical protein [Treponema sp.]
MRENINTLNYLAQVLYSESRNRDTVNKSRAQLYQSIIDDMQEQIDLIMDELLKAEREQS